jgi:GntR family transcriptional regulator of vanillate catabolism
MILRGSLRPGERVLEVDLAARLNLSRTPIRQALPALAQEGLLMPAGGRGYRVRLFTRDESLRALHLRALLEGFAARSIIMAGKGQQTAEALAPVLAQGDQLLAGKVLTDRLEEDYGALNAVFHSTLDEMAADTLLSELVARCNVVPFAAPAAVAFEEHSDAEIMDFLRYAHRQHHAIVDAFREGDAMRVEMLFREHAMTQESSMAARRLDIVTIDDE